MEKQNAKSEKKEEVKKLAVGALMLLIAIVVFSGVFSNSESGWRVLDLTNLLGKFGAIYEKVNFRGEGGTSAREGMMFALTLAPTCMLTMGLLQVFENFGVLEVARKLMTPIMKPLLGIPGNATLALIGSLSSSDVGAAMTRVLYEEEQITEDERDIFATFQYSSSGILTNYFGGASSVFGIIVVGAGVPFLYLFVIKIVEANIMRVILRIQARRAQAKNNENS